MPFSATVIPAKQFDEGEAISLTSLNLLATPTVNIEGSVGNLTLEDDSVDNAKVASNAAIALSKLASGSSGQIVVGNSSGVPTYVTASGDVTVSDAGAISLNAAQTGITSVGTLGSLAVTGNATAGTLTVGSSTAVSAVDTDISSVSASDDTLASAKSIKTYVDSQVQAKDALSELSGTTDDVTQGSSNLYNQTHTGDVVGSTALTIGNNKVLTQHIFDGNITEAKLASDSVTGDKIGDDQIDSEHYIAGSIDSEHLASNSVTEQKIGNDAVVAAHIAANAVGASEIASGVIASSHLASATDDNLKARANHSGTQTASTISDFDTEVANNSAVTANTAKVSNATHTGDVTGSTALTIAAGAVTAAKIADGAVTSAKLASDVLPASGSQVYTSSSGNWTCPTGVTKIKIQLWGAGGGGAGTGNNNFGTGGGGGAYCMKGNISVTAGTTYAYAVGAGSSGGDGTDTTFTANSTTYTAGGGKDGATRGSSNWHTTAGTGGTASNGDLNLSGQHARQAANYNENSNTDFGPAAGGAAAMGGSGGISQSIEDSTTEYTSWFDGQTPGGGGAGSAASKGGDGLIIIEW